MKSGKIVRMGLKQSIKRIFVGLLIFAVALGSAEPLLGKTSAAVPVILTQPQDVNVNELDPSPTLNIVMDGVGPYTYRWYRNSTNEISGSVMLNESSSTLTLSTSGPYESYYYVVVKNSSNESVTSDIVHVKVNGIVHASPPDITGHPAGASVNEGAPSPTLSVTATGSGTLTYQWYRNTTNSNNGGTMVVTAQSSTFAPPTGYAHDSYYYVVVTNTDNSVAGTKTASEKSNVARVTVSALANATPPDITGHPAGASVNEGAPSPTLSVTATGSGTLTYQWYRNTTNSNNGGTMVVTAQSSTFAPPTGYAHDSYYYVVVTNTDNSVAGTKTASEKSNVARVTVVDATAPTVSISSAKTSPTNASPFGITIAFSEPVTGFSIDDIVVTNGTAGDLYTANNVTYTANITPGSSGTVAVNIAAGVALDTAGNGNVAAAAYSIVYDGIAPAVTITSATTSPTNVSSFTVTIAFTEPVFSLAVQDIEVTNGSASHLLTSDSKTFTAKITPATEGTVTVGLAANIVADVAGNRNTAAAPFSIVSDKTAPTLTITSTAANPTNASPFSVTFTFSEAVSGFTVDDIDVSNGTAGDLYTANNVTYTAKLTPASNGTVAVNVAAGVAADTAGNGNTAAAAYSTVYDGTAPTLTITSAAANPTNASPFSVIFTFSEAVTGFTVDDIDVTNGTAGDLYTANNVTYTANITPASNGTVAVNVAAGVAADTAGNGNKAAAAYSTVYDGTAPTLTITSTAANPTNASPFSVTFTFSEAVSGFTVDDIAVTNGTASDLQPTDSKTYTAKITPASNGTVAVNVAAGVAADPAGNDNMAAAAYSTVYDATAPTLTLTSTAANPTNASPFSVTFAFSEAVSGFTVDDIDVSNGTAGDLYTANNVTYTAKITPASNGTVAVNVAAGVAVDAAGNGNTSAASYSTVYDGTAPTLTITSTAANPTNASPFSVTFTFSEAVSGFTVDDIAVTNGTADDLQPTDSKTYTANITPASNGTVAVNVAAGVAADPAGNGNTAAAATYSTVYDGTAPTVTITSTAANPTNASPFSVTFTFSEAVTGFTVDDIDVTNGTAEGLQTLDNVTYTANITPVSNGTVAVNVAAGVAADPAGNGNTAAAAYSTVYDGTAPILTTVNIASNNAAPSLSKVGDTITLTFSANETLGDMPEVTIAGQEAVVSEAGGVYTATYSMTAADAEGTIAFVVVISDLAGTEAVVTGTTDASFVIFDKTAPVPVITSPANGTFIANKRPTLTGTVEAGSIVTIAIDNETPSDVTADENGNWHFTPLTYLKDGEHTITVEATDPAGNRSEVQAIVAITVYTPYIPNFDIEVWVNGKVEKLGNASAITRNNRTTTTVTIDQQKLEDKLRAEGQGATVAIRLGKKSDIAIVELSAEMVDHMQKRSAALEFQTGGATYTLPAAQIDIGFIRNQLGQSVNFKDIKIRVEIAVPEADVMKIVNASAEKGNFAIVAPPLNFSVKGSFGGIDIEIAKFVAYVERTISLPDGVDPHKITTGIVVESDGTVRHVPTKIDLVDGNYYARINSLTNSMYAVVWHPLEFGDVANHWAKNAVNNMGSRMIIDGIGDGLFSPDREITRAEFAAIIVRGLGLKQEFGENVFTDVEAANWYGSAINTAYTYQLITGFADGTFRPNDKITREQAMVIISRAMALTNLQAGTGQSAEETLRHYADAADVSAWAISSIADSVKSGVVSGRTGAVLAPKAFITRAEVATIIERLLQKSDLI